jgi:hypothetical protein
MSPSALRIHLKSVLFHKCCNLCVSVPTCIHDTFSVVLPVRECLMSVFYIDCQKCLSKYFWVITPPQKKLLEKGHQPIRDIRPRARHLAGKSLTWVVWVIVEYSRRSSSSTCSSQALLYIVSRRMSTKHRTSAGTSVRILGIVALINIGSIIQARGEWIRSLRMMSFIFVVTSLCRPSEPNALRKIARTL